MRVSDLPLGKQKKNMLTAPSPPNRWQRHQTDPPPASRPVTAGSLQTHRGGASLTRRQRLLVLEICAPPPADHCCIDEKITEVEIR
jgi:hypothetical protein